MPAVKHSSYCRVCLKLDKTQENDLRKLKIFDQTAVQTLEDLFGIKIKKESLEDDNVPRKVCETCQKDIHDVLKVKQRVCGSHEAIENDNVLFTDEEETVEPKISKKRNIEDSAIQPNLLNFAEPLSPTKNETISKSPTENITSPEMPKQAKVPVCVVCKKIFTDFSTLLDHLKLIHKKAVNKTQSLQKTNEHQKEKQYCCMICLESFETPAALTAHQSVHFKNLKLPLKLTKTTENFTCAHCSKTFVRKESLVWHMKIHFNGAAQLQCETCGESFSTKKSLAIHIANHKEKLQTCSFCKESFMTMNLLKEHIKSHKVPQKRKIKEEKSPTRPFVCGVCNKIFQRIKNYKQHQQTHSTEAEKLYKCENCNLAFSHASSLRYHINKVHDPSNQPKCDYCHATFTTDKSLQYHLRIHKGEKPFQCEFCAMSFRGHETLKQHIRTHTAEKPYKCLDCDNMAFISAKALRRHKLKHTSGNVKVK